jgi:hypothetical protein
MPNHQFTTPKVVYVGAAHTTVPQLGASGRIGQAQFSGCQPLTSQPPPG